MNGCWMCSSTNAALASAIARAEALRAALEACIETAEEGWSYASDYFREKWDAEGQLARARVALAHATEVPR